MARPSTPRRPAALPPVARLLSDLIAVPSVNPAFLPAGDPRTGEARVAAHLESLARRAGLEVSRQPVAPGRDNLIVRLRPGGALRHRILLAPHLDTIGEPNLDPQLRPRVAGGRLYGRGACDTKGCVATFFQALLDVAASGVRPAHTELVFVGFVDEENAQLGSRHYAELSRRPRHRAGLRADLAVVGEPTRLEVVSAHKGDVWLRLRTHGVAAHGATPHLGRNAVAAMAKAVLALEGDYAASLRRRKPHPLLGRPTLNVGAIRGGTQPNVVPALCEVDIDRRFLPGETPAGVQREIQGALRRARVSAEFVDLRSAPCPALETDPALPLVQAFLKAAGQRRTRGVHYFCDAASLAAGGIPSIVFGPGDIAQAHTSEEWIEVAQLESARESLVRFLRGQP
jgi:acetylornithine deacetylase/succinyl-diaminopimelate desuccinylase-like protein